MLNQEDIFRFLVKLNAADTMHSGENYGGTKHNIAMEITEKG